LNTAITVTEESLRQSDASTLQLDFHKREFVGIRVDDIVLHSSRPGVGGTCLDGDFPYAIGFHEAENTIMERDHDIVQFVTVPAGRSAWGETPLGYAEAIVVDLDT
jgi:hypothetical protein